MISFKDRMALVGAGYTASQIAEFDNDVPSNQEHIPEPVHEPITEPVHEPITEPVQEPIHEPKQEANPADFAAIMQSINNSMAAMLAAMQAQNIKSVDMGNPEKETPGDILAKLLNP